MENMCYCKNLSKVDLHTTTTAHTFSIVLIALVDANYNFIYVDVGAQGRISDAGVFNNCSLSEKLKRNTMNVPVEESFLSLT